MSNNLSKYIKAKRHFPNFLSLIRILLTPFVIWFLLRGAQYSGIAMAIFTVGVITDFYDGYFARKHAFISRTGNFLDPLADKFLVLSTFITFWYLDLLPILMLSIIAFREFLVTVLRFCLDYVDKSMATSVFGKWKTASQFVAIYVLFLAYWGVTWITPLILSFVLYVVIGLTLFSGIHYFYVNKKLLKVCKGLR